jgi:hypothetical protein
MKNYDPLSFAIGEKQEAEITGIRLDSSPLLSDLAFSFNKRSAY